MRISLSSILDEVQRSEKGRKDAGSFGGLFGFNSGMIFASFHKFGIFLRGHEWLSNAFRVVMAVRPKCFKRRLDILSGQLLLSF